MDELDAYLDSVLTIDGAEPEAEPIEEIEAVAEDTAAEEVELEDDADASPPEMVASSDDDEVPEEDAELEPAPEPDVTPDLQAAQQSFRELSLQQQLAAQQQQLQMFQQQQQIQRAQMQLAAMRQQWEQMDPDDAHRAELQFVANNFMATIQQQQAQLSSIAQQQAVAVEEQRQAAAKPIAIQKAIEIYGLKPGDAEFLEVAQTGDQLAAMAQRMSDQRKRQTAAARQAKAQKVKANPALVPTAQGTPALAPGQTPKSLDEYNDFALYAR